MPQGRKKVPFSAKKKKEQLQAKRQRKLQVHQAGSDDDGKTLPVAVRKINQQPFAAGRGKSNPNRYVLQFYKESEEELNLRKEEARNSLELKSEEELEIDLDDYFLPELDFPKRPPWDFSMTKEQLEARENKYFREYISAIEKQFDWSELSYFELNLETWRQLWRVLEMSDIVLLIVDIRFPALMFPPSLYNYASDLGKEMILVLNKIDLAPAPLVVAWKHYFLSKFPNLHVLTFTSFPSYNIQGNENTDVKNRKRRGTLKMAAEGAQKLMECVQSIVSDRVNLSSWAKKIKDEMSLEYEDEDLHVEETIKLNTVDTSFHEHVKYANGIVTIGCVGQPNVGKSSLMNAIMGKKVVSVSKTPGHTKHFQTIFLTPTVKLCDCPGLVFPSKVPRPLQVLTGSYPIAQLREPYSSVRFLAERLDLVKILNLKHPDGDEVWSAWDICDGWAKSRGFFTARTSRPDTYRAANHLLRLTLDGKVCLCLRPRGYLLNQAKWESHPEVGDVMWVQARSKSNKEQARHPQPFAQDYSSEEDMIDGEGVRSSDEDADDETSEGVSEGKNEGEGSEGSVE